MGLTIHWKLKLDGPASATKNKAGQIVRDLELYANGMRHEGLLAEVSEARYFDQAAIQAHSHDQESDWRWLMIQAEKDVVVGEHTPGYQTWRRFSPIEGFAVRTWPGQGCEEANFGLFRYPRFVEDKEGTKIPTRLPGWRWGSFCKTTYASQPVSAHLAVVTLLDFLKGFSDLGVEVSDEGDFWENRDVSMLARNFHDDAVMLASFVAAFKGMGLQVIGPIQERPDWEALAEHGKVSAEHTLGLLRVIKGLEKPRRDDA